MQPTSPASSAQPEFPFGWRFVKRPAADGGETLEQVALTLEDVLHPLEGDVIPENPLHESDCRYLADVFSTRTFGPAQTLVTRDLLVDWGVSGIRNHSPDVAVFVGLEREANPAVGVLDLKDLGGRCELVVEVVSPSTRNNDVVAKMDHYHRVGIPFYVIIDQRTDGDPRTLRAYRRKANRYAEVESDDRNRIDVPLLGLILGMKDNRIVCHDLKTDRELGDYARIVHDLEAADRRAEQQQQAIEEQVEARQAAERRAAEVQQEADRRAEQQQQAIKEQVEARQAAERRAAEVQQEADRQREETDKERQEKLLVQQEADRQREETDKERQEKLRAQLDADRHRQEALRVQEEADKQRQEVLRVQEEAERQRQESERQRLAQQQIILEMQEKMRLLKAGGTANPAS